MNFIIRQNGKYLDISVEYEGTTLKLGLHNSRDLEQLGMELLEAATTIMKANTHDVL